MSQFGTCPVCQSEINPDRLTEGLHICQSCGWTASTHNSHQEEKGSKSFIFVAVSFSIVITLSFIHAMKWDGYFTEMISLEVKQITGTANSQEMMRIAEICKDRHNPDCVEGFYAKAVNLEPKNTEAVAQYAKILVYNGKYALGADMYRRYFELGGKNTDIAFEYAVQLGEQGFTDKSIKYFNYVLNSKSNVFQVTVTQAYVNMLFKAGLLEQAQKVILSVRKKGDNAPYFMDRRLIEIKRSLASR